MMLSAGNIYVSISRELFRRAHAEPIKKQASYRVRGLLFFVCADIIQMG